jgi:hypothetical protein
LTISRLGPPTSRSGNRTSPIKERESEKGKYRYPSRDKERELDRERRSKLSSPSVLKNKSLELRKSLLLESETSDTEDDIFSYIHIYFLFLKKSQYNFIFEMGKNCLLLLFFIIKF